MKRTIVFIDENKCDGCGVCIPNCQEGALQIVDGKAKLVSDVLCDGFGACLGHCPQDAISMIEREAEEYTETAVEEHLAQKEAPMPQVETHVPHHHHGHGHTCPGSAMRDMRRSAPRQAPAQFEPITSSLQNWPVQLHLLNPDAPYLQNANLLIAADCVAFAMPDFHASLIQDRIVTIGCPKLDDVQPYVEKLAHIFTNAGIQSVTVAIMEVPCCGGMVQVVGKALELAGVDMPVRVITIGVKGEIKDSQLYMFKRRQAV